MTNFAIHTVLLLLGSATVASARLSLLRSMAPVHAEKHSMITPHDSEFGQSHHRQDSAAALRDMRIINTAPPTMTGESTDTKAGAATTTSLSPSLSPSSAPSYAPSSFPNLELDGNGHAVVTPGIEEGDSAVSSPSSVSPAKTAVLAAIVVCALAAGLIALHRIMGVGSSSASAPVPSGADTSLSSGSDHGAMQVDDSPA